jgi:hypothetical protein
VCCNHQVHRDFLITLYLIKNRHHWHYIVSTGRELVSEAPLSSESSIAYFSSRHGITVTQFLESLQTALLERQTLHKLGKTEINITGMDTQHET